MKNKILPIISAIIFAIYFVAQCFLLVYDSNQLIIEIAHYTSVIFQIIGGLFLYFSGSFRYSLWRKIANFGIAAFLIGILFRVQRWLGGVVFMNLGITACLLGYITHFVKKRNKTLKDTLKLGWLLSICATIILLLYHFAYVGYVGMLGSCILAVAMAIHMKELWSTKAVNNAPRSAIFEN